MSILKFSLILFSCMLLSSSCKIFKKSPKEEKTDAPTKPIDFKSMTEMVFGWGGGFTGMVEVYQLSKDGTLKQGDEVKKKLDSKAMKTVFTAFKKVNFAKIKLNDPGNLYYFMAARAGANEQRLIWNDQTLLPPEVKAAYDALVNVTR